MVLADILKQMRRSLGEVNATLGIDAPEYTDAFLTEYVIGAALHMDVAGVSDYTYVVDDDRTGILPEPSTIDGVLLAARAAADLVAGDLKAKVRAGELGIQFRTGVDEVSTATAARLVADEAKKLDYWYRQLKTLKLSRSTDNGARVQ